MEYLNFFSTIHHIESVERERRRKWAFSGEDCEQSWSGTGMRIW